MNFQYRSYEKELLDRDDIPFADIRRNMQELETINNLLGGHRITTKGIKYIMAGSSRPVLTVCEIGCGGGDNLHAIKKHLQGSNVIPQFIGIDINSHCIEYAKSRNLENSTWMVSDYRDVTFDTKPDIIFSSLFCHHFDDEELIFMFNWMKENSNDGFFINDLQRHPLAYHSIRLLTRLFSKSYLVKNDAPLSVRRGFKRSELKLLLARAGIEHSSINWEWAFRWLVTVKHEQPVTTL